MYRDGTRTSVLHNCGLIENTWTSFAWNFTETNSHHATPATQELPFPLFYILGRLMTRRNAAVELVFSLS